MRKLLKKIASLFRIFGIEVKLIKKNNLQAVLHLNDAETANKAWSDPNIIKGFYSKELQLFYARILDILKERNVTIDNKSLVDVGCGTGMLLKYFYDRAQGVKPTGLEYAESALVLARKNFPEAKFALHDIMQVYPEKFDIVLCTEVLEHLQYPAKALKNLLDMTNDKGVLFVSVPNGRVDTFEGHINFWSPESWKIFISENCNGFSFETNLFNKQNQYAIIWK